ncbi:MAG: SDR family oxidoreductase [Betaproteobacteria bacterium]|nr:SDR family oxidoreductase [Betaproteobacteria bacterium]
MFSGKVIAITGASEGIGAELARQVAGKNVWLALAARNQEKLEAVAAECRALGAEALAIRCDVSVESDCRNFIEEAARKYSSLDILVNNAGVSGHARFEEVTDFGWYEDLMRVNYMGSLYCTRYALPHLKKRRGQIVAISSLAGLVGIPGRTAYSPTKAAQALFFEALRLELQESGVDITIVYPGVVATDIRLHGYGPDGQPAEKSSLKEENAMPVQECVRQIIAATRARKRELVMTLPGKVGLWLKLAFPKVVDRMILRALKKDG